MIMEENYAYKYFRFYVKNNLYIIISHLSSATKFKELNV